MKWKILQNILNSVWTHLKNYRSFKFFLQSIYLFINNYLVSFKVTHLRYNTLMPAFFPILKTLLKCAFWHRQQLLFWFFFYLLNRSKTLSFPSAAAKSDEYGGWDMITVLFLTKNFRTSIDVWAGALSWCKIRD